jgi:hypothetical protein
MKKLLIGLALLFAISSPLVANPNAEEYFHQRMDKAFGPTEEERDEDLNARLDKVFPGTAPRYSGYDGEVADTFDTATIVKQLDSYFENFDNKMPGLFQQIQNTSRSASALFDSEE